jgi:hypothetical protein
LSYAWFRADAVGHHLIHLAIHLGNCLLLYGLLWRATQRWRLAFLSALVYATLPTYALAVFWIGVADPLATLFSLLTAWFCLTYLRVLSARAYALAWLMCAGALLSKETGAVLPGLLMLMDWWVVGNPLRWRIWLARYAPFFLLLLAYAGLVFPAVFGGVFTRSLGYGTGGNPFLALGHHLGVLVFPWGLDAPWNFILLGGLGSALIWSALRRELKILFLGALAIVPVLPILPFPISIAQAPRYLYLALMASAIGAGIGFELMRRARRLGAPLALALTLIAWRGASSINENALSFAGDARQARTQFRAIYLRHPAFAPGTYLYFIDLPFITQYASGMMFLRYGDAVTTSSTGQSQRADLRNYPAAFIFFQDEQNVWQAQAVAPVATINAAPQLPVWFDQTLALEGVEFASTRVRRGDVLILLTYWRRAAPIARDYTVFAQLLDRDGNIIAGADRLILREDQPTSAWRTDPLAANGIVISIGKDIAPGTYRLALGVYDRASMERGALYDARGQRLGEAVALEPIQVDE